MEHSTHKLSTNRTEYKIESMMCVKVAEGFNFLLCIFENQTAQFLDMETMSVAHTMSFNEKLEIKDKKRL